MRFFGKSRHTPTDDQRKRLAQIANPDQRRTLLTAIRRGETIPDYAWMPFPEGTEQIPEATQLHQQLLQYAASSDRDMTEVIASLRPDSHIQFYADRAKETAREDTGCLCTTPLQVPDLTDEADHASGILAWGIFNPYGPTLSFLALIGVPEHPESLLYLTQMNPFQCTNLVYGLVPDSIRDGCLNEILDELLSEHSTGEFGLFSDCLPSFIMPLAPRIKFVDLVHKGLAHVGSEKVQRECVLLRRIPNDPWGMATEMLRVFGERQDEVRSAPIRQAATADDLDEWLSLITDKDHWVSYISQMRHACAGAIEHGPTHLKVMDWEPAERVLRKLWLDGIGE
jgi:hypothetical protein